MRVLARNELRSRRQRFIIEYENILKLLQSR